MIRMFVLNILNSITYGSFVCVVHLKNTFSKNYIFYKFGSFSLDTLLKSIG